MVTYAEQRLIRRDMVAAVGSVERSDRYPTVRGHTPGCADCLGQLGPIQRAEVELVHPIRLPQPHCSVVMAAVTIRRISGSSSVPSNIGTGPSGTAEPHIAGIRGTPAALATGMIPGTIAP